MYTSTSREFIKARRARQAKASICAPSIAAEKAVRVRALKGPAKGRKFLSPRSASRNRMHPRRRILRLATTPRAATRHGLAETAAKGTIAEAIEAVIAVEIEDADVAGALDGAVEEEEEEEATGGHRADAICLPQSTLRRRASGIPANTTIAARWTAVRRCRWSPVKMT